jgi:hypothetical protein
VFGKPEGKRPFRRPRSRWEDNIKMVLRKMRFDVMGWIYLAWKEPVVGFSENITELASSIKCGEFHD